MRLKYQLFFAMLLSSGLLIALMYAINSWSFNRGFLGYINSIEVARIEPIVDELALNYTQHGSWEWITSNHRHWRDILDRHLGAPQAPPPDIDGPPSNNGFPPLPPPEHRTQQSNGDIKNSRPDSRNSGPDSKNGWPDAKNNRSDDSERSPSNLTLDPRLLLADTKNNILYGKPGSRFDSIDTSWLPITADKQTVGYLGYRRLKQPPGQLDQVFAEQQKRSFAYAAIATIALSALLAAILSIRIVNPILLIRNTVRRLRKGNYDQHIAMTRRDEIGGLARDINRLATTLDRNLNARQQWLAEISHELRTPVAILQGELEALLDGVMPVDEVAIKSLHDESLRLSRLINDLHKLTLSDIGALDYHFERVDLVELIAERCRQAQPLANTQSLSITKTIKTQTAFMKADRARLAQLADNLFQNSIRYTDPGGKIEISLSTDDKNICLCWKDTTPGVTSEQLPRLFEPLYRTDASRNRDTGGSGLGLAIVSKIVEAHEGRVEASHSELGGLSITLHFPLHR